MNKMIKYLSEHIEIIVGFGFVIWMISFIQDAEPESRLAMFTIPFTVFLFCLYKSFYFILYLKERIAIHYVNNRNFNRTVFAVALTLTSISISFAVDYLLIDHYVQDSFSGYSGESLISRIFDFTYFTIMTMTTLGYSGVEPSGYWSKSIAAIQVLTAFTIIVFLIANMDEIKPYDKSTENI